MLLRMAVILSLTSIILNKMGWVLSSNYLPIHIKNLVTLMRCTLIYPHSIQSTPLIEIYSAVIAALTGKVVRKQKLTEEPGALSFREIADKNYDFYKTDSFFQTTRLVV